LTDEAHNADMRPDLDLEQGLADVEAPCGAEGIAVPVGREEAAGCR
jgi:hypothetical protein